MNSELKIARIRAGFSQHKLAFKIGISQTIISTFEQGYKKPNQEQAELIAEALNVSIKNIFPEIKEQPILVKG